MVQSASWETVSKQVSNSWDNSKKSGFEAIQKQEKEKKEMEKKKQEDNKYGAWGPTFKNKDHFGSLHHC